MDPVLIVGGVAFKLPRSVELVDSLPHKAMGKPLKAQLRDKHWTGSDRKI